MHPGFSDAQNNEPANWDSQDMAIEEGQTQYLGVQQPSEIKVPASCPLQRMAQLGSGYSVVVVEVTVVVEVFAVVVSVVTTVVVLGPVVVLVVVVVVGVAVVVVFV